MSKFWFHPINKFENSEILESFLLLQSLTLFVTQAIEKNKLRQKCGLRRKMNISEVSEFLILPYNQNRKLENLGNMSLTSNSDSSYNWRFKNYKNMNKAENGKVWIWLKRINKNFWDFQVSNFSLYPKLKLLGNLEKFCFIYLFITLFNVGELK